LQHSFFFDGNEKRIAWSIQSGETKVDQIRTHPDIYLNQVTKEQAKLIALHVGIFWGVGKFIIKNNDHIRVMTDDKSLLSYFSKNNQFSDELITARVHFINHLIKQRELKMDFEIIAPEKNYISKLV